MPIIEKYLLFRTFRICFLFWLDLLLGLEHLVYKHNGLHCRRKRRCRRLDFSSQTTQLKEFNTTMTKRQYTHIFKVEVFIVLSGQPLAIETLG